MAPPFSQTVIAVVWYFDKTLIPGNMQSPLFARYGVDERRFWDEVDALRHFYRAHGARRVADEIRDSVRRSLDDEAAPSEPRVSDPSIRLG